MTVIQAGNEEDCERIGILNQDIQPHLVTSSYTHSSHQVSGVHESQQKILLRKLSTA